MFNVATSSESKRNISSNLSKSCRRTRFELRYMLDFFVDRQVKQGLERYVELDGTEEDPRNKFDMASLLKDPPKS